MVVQVAELWLCQGPYVGSDLAQDHGCGRELSQQFYGFNTSTLSVHILSVYNLRAKVRMVEQVLPVLLLQLTTHLPAGEELRQVDAPWAGEEGEDATRDKKE